MDKKVNELQEIINQHNNIVPNPVLNVSLQFQELLNPIYDQINKIQKSYTEQINSIMQASWMEVMNSFKESIGIHNPQKYLTNLFANQFSGLFNTMHLTKIQNELTDFSGTIYSLLNEGITKEEENEITETDSKLITEIYEEKSESKETDFLIVLSPVNDQVLKYLSENPEALYQLRPGEFELVMTEIYRKLGYDVQRTQSTRDGGKDIILRKPTAMGDFIYYVECKKYAPKRPIGIGIVRSMVGTIDTDKVNGGIIATTSYFTRDVRRFILDNNLSYQVQMHDFEKIKNLLNGVVKK